MAYSPYYSPYGMQMPYSQPQPDQLAQLRQIPQPQMPQQPMQQTMPQPMDMIWVQGEAAAKAYMVVNGGRAVLWDSESPTIFIKSVDTNGIPSMKILEYAERADMPQMPSAPRRRMNGDYVTRAEFNALAAKLDAMTAKEVQDDGEPAV